MHVLLLDKWCSKWVFVLRPTLAQYEAVFHNSGMKSEQAPYLILSNVLSAAQWTFCVTALMSNCVRAALATILFQKTNQFGRCLLIRPGT